jgi:hypothetical protein
MNYDLASQMAHENLAAVRLPMQQHALKKDVVMDPINDKVEEEASVVFDSSQAGLEEMLLHGARCQKGAGPKPSFQKEKDWPLARCSQCNDTKEKWRHMESTGPHIDKTNTTFYFYRCLNCILKNVVGIKTEAEARRYIAELGSGYKNRSERNAEFESCVERVAATLPRVISRSEKVKLARDLRRHETGDLEGVYKVDEQLYKEVPTIPRLAPHGPRKVSSNSQTATRGSSALTSRKR